MKLTDTSASDLKAIVEMELNSANARFIMPYDLQRHQQVIDDPDEVHLSIMDAQARLVGFVILAGLSSNNKSMELRRIVVSEKNKGHGSRAIELIKQRSFELYGCHRLWLDVFDFNQRAIHVYEKLGFRREGLLRECVLTDQGHQSLVILSLLRQEYMEQKK